MAETTFGKYVRGNPTSRATFTVQANVDGEVESVAITTAGTGYQVGDILNLFTGSVAGLGAQFTVTGINYATGAITSVSITAAGGAGGDNYVDNEILTDATTTINSADGFGATADYYNLYSYELAGTTTSEYAAVGTGLTLDYTVTGNVVTLSGDSIGNSAGANYKVGDIVYVSGDTGVKFAVTTVNAGAVTGLAIIADYSTKSNATYTNQTSVLVDRNTLAPTGTLTAKQQKVKTLTTSAAPKKKVQFNLINGVKVFAEPAIVVSGGTLEGRDLRAEDIGDAERCYAAGYDWVHVTEVDGTRGEYGYCVQPASAFASTLSKAECERSGFFWDIDSGASPNQCVNISDKTDGGAWDIFVTTTVPGKAAPNEALYSTKYGPDYLEALCRLGGMSWNGTSCEAFATTDHASLVTQATCVAKDGVWIAGVCYSPATFGNGQGGDWSQKTRTKVG